MKPEELKDAMWTGDGLDGIVRRVLEDGSRPIARYSELKKGDRFIQFPHSPTQKHKIATAAEDARVYYEEGEDWGFWGVLTVKIPWPGPKIGPRVCALIPKGKHPRKDLE